MHISEPLFPQYEDAVDSFLRAGGHNPSVILSPPSLAKRYKSQFAGSMTYTGGVRIEEAEQTFVSVRGTTIEGQDFEWPESE